MKSVDQRKSWVSVSQWFMTELGSPRFLWVLVFFAIVLGAPALWTGLQVDDYLARAILMRTPFAEEHYDGPLSMFNFVTGDAAQTHDLMDLGLLPWWTLENVRLRFFRPITVLTHWIDYQLWPDSPLLMHAQNLLWFVLAMAMVTLLYRRLMAPAWLAGLAALLYTIDDAHAMAAGWVANRNGLMMLLFGVLSLLAHIRWRSMARKNSEENTRLPAWSWCVVSCGCLLLSVLSNEGGIAVCAYLFAYAVFLDGGPLFKRLLTLAPYASLIIVWRLAYSAMGYGTWGSPAYVDPVRSPLRFATAAIERAPTLFLGQWALPPSDIQIMVPGWAQGILALAGTALFLCITAALIPLLKRDPLARFWFTGMILALIPICAPFPMDRLLLFVGIGAMGLLAQFIAAVMQPGPEHPRRSIRALCWTLIVLHLMLAPILFPVRIVGFALFGGTLDTFLKSVPFDESAQERTLVAINAPNPFFMYYLPLLRSLEGKPLPMRMRNLGPSDLLPQRISMTREDDRTMVVWSDKGYFWMFVRDAEHPLAVGETVKLPGMTAEVRSLVPEGWPHTVAFTFDKPLEDPSFQWVRLKDGLCVPWRPPSVGESIEVDPSEG